MLLDNLGCANEHALRTGRQGAERLEISMVASNMIGEIVEGLC